MFISELKVSNFKCFGKNGNVLRFNVPNGSDIGSGLNIFIGNNNTGKSTIFEAINFLRNGTKKDINLLQNKQNTSDLSVELTFGGNINEIIDNFVQDNKKSVFKQYIYKENGNTLLKLQRSSKDAGKRINLWDKNKKSLTIKVVLMRHLKNYLS